MLFQMIKKSLPLSHAWLEDLEAYREKQVLVFQYSISRAKSLPVAILRSHGSLLSSFLSLSESHTLKKMTREPIF